MRTFNFTLAAISVLAEAQRSQSPKSYRQEYQQWISEHANQSPQSAEEWQMRYEAFSETMRGMEERRDARRAIRGSTGDDDDEKPLKPNKFATWTKEEREMLGGMLGGKSFTKDGSSQSPPANQTGGARRRGGRSLAGDVDNILWDENVTGSVDDQGECGACAYHSFLHHLESVHAIKNSTTTPKQSKQNFLDCSYYANKYFTKRNFGFSYSLTMNYGCGGAYPTKVLDYLKYYGSMPQLSDDEYKEDESTTCSYSTSPSSCACKYSSSEATKISDWTELSSSTSSVDAYVLANALKTGPVSIGIASGKSMEDYTEGILDRTNEICGSRINHSMLLVGFNPGNDANRRLLHTKTYDDDGLKCFDSNVAEVRADQCFTYRDPTRTWVKKEWGTRFHCCYDTAGDGDGGDDGGAFDQNDYSTWGDFDSSNVDASKAYWIIKNSWGSDWGENGYMRVRFEDTSNGWCGMYEEAWTMTA